MERERCYRCNQELDDHKIVWLELNRCTLAWYLPGQCPEAESQGCFPFGADCAKRVLPEEEEK